jgi:hypothetical protein
MTYGVIEYEYGGKGIYEQAFLSKILERNGLRAQWAW